MSANTSENLHWDALADLVKDRRLELAIHSQRRAAEDAGIHINTWNAVERGRPVRMDSLDAIARVLRWHPSFVTAILREGKDAPKVAAASGLAHLAATASASDVRSVDLDDTGMAQEEVTVATPETVRAKARIPGPEPATGRMRGTMPSVSMNTTGRVWAPVVPLDDKTGFIHIPISVPLDFADDLDADDLSRLFKWVQDQGVAFATAIVQAKRSERANRAERAKHGGYGWQFPRMHAGPEGEGFETKSEWPPMNVGGDKQDDDKSDDES